MITRTPKSKPVGYESELGEYGPQVYDSVCGEPTGWGFKIVREMPRERFEALKSFGNMECIQGDAQMNYKNSWFLITDRLTAKEAEMEYGKVSDIELGPKGGFQSITFGDKTFVQRDLHNAIKKNQNTTGKLKS